jgi:hypothetical protein
LVPNSLAAFCDQLLPQFEKRHARRLRRRREDEFGLALDTTGATISARGLGFEAQRTALAAQRAIALS